MPNSTYKDAKLNYKDAKLNLHDGKDAKLFSADDSILTLCPSPAVINSGAMLKTKTFINLAKYFFKLAIFD